MKKIKEVMDDQHVTKPLPTAPDGYRDAYCPLLGKMLIWN